MITFKAKRLDNGTVLGSDSWIEGHYMSREIGVKRLHYITIHDLYDWIPIDPTTLVAIINGREIPIENLGDVRQELPDLYSD